MQNSASGRGPIVAAWVSVAAFIVAWFAWAYLAAILTLVVFAFRADSVASDWEAVAITDGVAAQALLVLVVATLALVPGHAARTWASYGRWIAATVTGGIVPALLAYYIVFYVFG